MVVLITGAANGLGYELAQELQRRQHKLVLFDIDQDRLNQLKTEFKGATIIKTDITKELEIESAANTLKNEHLQPEVVINNAGIGIYKKLVDLSLDEWNKQLNVNVTGAFLICKYFLPGMLERKKGDIVNIGSGRALSAEAEKGAYTTSKFALRGLTQSLILELQDTGVRTTVLELDSMLTNFRGALKEKVTRQNKGELFLQPKEIAAIIADLIENKSQWQNELRIEATATGMRVTPM